MIFALPPTDACFHFSSSISFVLAHQDKFVVIIWVKMCKIASAVFGHSDRLKPIFSTIDFKFMIIVCGPRALPLYLNCDKWINPLPTQIWLLCQWRKREAETHFSVKLFVSHCIGPIDTSHLVLRDNVAKRKSLQLLRLLWFGCHSLCLMDFTCRISIRSSAVIITNAHASMLLCAYRQSTTYCDGGKVA